MIQRLSQVPGGRYSTFEPKKHPQKTEVDFDQKLIGLLLRLFQVFSPTYRALYREVKQEN
jgi:hypothetical protein